MSAREGREAWDWARKHHANDHTGDPRPHRATCRCRVCEGLEPRPTMKVWLDECPYCGLGPCRGSARSSLGIDIDRFHAVHPRQRDTARVETPDTSDWPRTPYCDGQRAAILDPFVRHAVGLSGGVLDDGGGEWYAGFDDALIGRFYGQVRA